MTLQTLQRVYDRHAVASGGAFSEFLSQEFYTGERGLRTIGETAPAGRTCRRAALSLWLEENAHADLVFRHDASRCYALRLSAAETMPSGFVKRADGACLRFVPLDPPRVEPRTWHRIELKMRGGRFQARVDGQERGALADGSFADGSLGFASGFPTVKIDRLEVTGTEPLPGGGEREFLLAGGNPYRRTGRGLLLVCGFGLYFLLEARLLRAAGPSGGKALRGLRRGLVLPGILVVAALFLPWLSKVLLLSFSASLLLGSRVRLLLGLPAVRGRFGHWRRAKRAAAALLCLAAAAAIFSGLTSHREIRRMGSAGAAAGAAEDADERAVELNFPFVPEPDDLENFVWQFEACLGEGSVAEIVFRKRGDREPVVAPEAGEGQNWYAFVLSTEERLTPGFAKVSGLDGYAKKAPERQGAALPAGAWFPVRLEANGNRFSCRAADGAVADGLADNDLVSGRCRITLIRGSLAVRRSRITPLAPRDRYPSFWESRISPGGDPPREPLRGPGSLEGLNWYLKSSYRFENTLLSNQTFRDRRFRRDKPEGTVRIVCIGGSSTYGILLPEGSEADYPHELERQLGRAFPSRSFQVINGGVVGTYSLRSVEYLEAVLLPFGPDLVLVNLAWNDNIIPAAMERGYPGFREQQEGWRRNPLLAPFLYAGAWGGFVCRGAEFAGRMKAGRPGAFVIHRGNLPVYEENLHRLVDTAESRGVRIAFILEPSIDVLVAPRGQEVLADFYAIERRVASERGIPLIDPGPALRSHRYDDLFCDVMHLSPAGHRRLARTISERIIKSWPGLFAAGARHGR